MEADLDRYYHTDIRDHWRYDDTGRRLLTLRQMVVRVRHLPADAATVVAVLGHTSWTRDQVLLAHVWQAAAQSKSPHPQLAEAASEQRTKRGMTPERRRKWMDARRRARIRQRAIEAGDIT